MDLPKNVLMDQLESLVEILSNKLTGSTAAEIKAVNNSLKDKVIEAAIFVGLAKLQGDKYLITESGKKFYQAQDQRGKNEAIRELLKNIKIYNLTTEYLHYNKIEKPNKLDIGSYWNTNFSSTVKGMSEDDLESAILFFLRFLELASLGKIIYAGRGRETRLVLDMVELAKYITSSTPPSEAKVLAKLEKEVAKSESEETISEEESVSSSVKILNKLNPELVWSDLDSDGAKKFLIDKLNVLNNDNIVLAARVEEYQKLDSENAVLNEKVNNLKKDNFFRATVNSIGGIILGAALTISEPIYKIVGCVLAVVLIVISVFLKEIEQVNKQDS